MQGMQRTQVANDMAGICHVIWLVSNLTHVLDLVYGAAVTSSQSARTHVDLRRRMSTHVAVCLHASVYGESKPCSHCVRGLSSSDSQTDSHLCPSVGSRSSVTYGNPSVGKSAR